MSTMREITRLQDQVRMLRQERDSAVESCASLRTQLDFMKESLELTLGPLSSLPPMSKDVVRGFFTGSVV